MQSRSHSALKGNFSPLPFPGWQFFSLLLFDARGAPPALPQIQTPSVPRPPPLGFLLPSATPLSLGNEKSFPIVEWPNHQQASLFLFLDGFFPLKTLFVQMSPGYIPGQGGLAPL